MVSSSEINQGSVSLEELALVSASSETDAEGNVWIAL